MTDDDASMPLDPEAVEEALDAEEEEGEDMVGSEEEEL